MQYASRRWSTPDGQKFTEDLEHAGIVTPEGWAVTATWSIMSTQFDPDGWQYATALDSPFWHFENNSTLCKLCHPSVFPRELST